MTKLKVAIWNDDKTRDEVGKRFRNAARERSSYEPGWKRNEATIYSTSNYSNRYNLGLNRALDFSITEALSTGIDQSNADVNVAYTFKNLRFIHAQMSSNPPAVVMRPTSSDQDDHRKADAADRISRWAMRHYSLQELVDQLSLQTLIYGTAFLKTVWDSTRGDIIGTDPETDEIKLEGDIAISTPFIWNMYVDPDAKSWAEVKWVAERLYMDYEEACVRWPDRVDELKESRIEDTNSTSEGYNSELKDSHYNCVELIEYWETGLPTNGYLGRYCITTRAMEIVEPCRPSPFRFKRAGAVSQVEMSEVPDEVKAARIEKLPEQARLPYIMLTDIDIPNTVWGRSAVEYAAQLQDNLNRLDTAKLDNIQAHGNARMILPEASEIQEDALSNSPWDVIKITGNTPPYFMSPPQLMPDMSSERTNYISGINDVMGVNESMFGQQSREQSGASMQYATNQGNMIRRRLFNKYVLAVESLTKNILNLVRKHWSINRTIHVLGKEKALEAIDLKGADIDGGYDVIGEYGTTLSLDPVTRQEQILTMQPLLEKAGVPMRMTLKMLKLSDLESLYSELELADNRQKEIFDEMIATGRYVPPKKYRDHANMIAFAMRYFMTQEFETLTPEVQELCERHIEERAQLAAMETGAGAPNQQATELPAPGSAPAGGQPPSVLPPIVSA